MNENENPLNESFADTGNDSRDPPKREINTMPLFPLRQILPDVVDRLKNLLAEDGELDLAVTVEGLLVYDRCWCGADYCAMVHTQPRPRGRFPLDRRTIVFWNSKTIDETMRLSLGDSSIAPTTEFTTIIEVEDEAIALIEILDDHESRRRLVAALPGEDTAE
jgi:hypothetical protein